MTRFARAEGSKGSNKRVLEEATPWSEMVKQRKKSKTSESSTDKKKSKSINNDRIKLENESLKVEKIKTDENQNFDKVIKEKEGTAVEQNETPMKKKKKKKKERVILMEEKPTFEVKENGKRVKVFKDGTERPFFDLPYEDGERMTRYEEFWVKKDRIPIILTEKEKMVDEGLNKAQLKKKMMKLKRKEHKLLRDELIYEQRDLLRAASKDTKNEDNKKSKNTKNKDSKKSNAKMKKKKDKKHKHLEKETEVEKTIITEKEIDMEKEFNEEKGVNAEKEINEKKDVDAEKEIDEEKDVEPEKEINEEKDVDAEEQIKEEKGVDAEEEEDVDDKKQIKEKINESKNISKNPEDNITKENKKFEATKPNTFGFKKNMKHDLDFKFEENDEMTFYDGFWVRKAAVKKLDALKKIRKNEIINNRFNDDENEELTDEEKIKFGRLMKMEKRNEAKKLRSDLKSGSRYQSFENDKYEQYMVVKNKSIDQEMVRFDGFNITKEGADRLASLKEKLRDEGMTNEDIGEVIKKERRKEEKSVKRTNNVSCYKCRKFGHLMSQCPEMTEASGICYKCGSTEHTAYDCTDKSQGSFMNASCFICGELGHFSRSCPDNPRGLYPNGGCCKICGSIEHFARNCPESQEENEQKLIKLNTIDGTNLEALEERNFEFSQTKRQNKIVLFD